MLIKYTYPVTGDFFLPDHWPISWDKFRVTWTVSDGKAQSLTVSVRTNDLSTLPRIRDSSEPDIAADIRVGHLPHHADVESIVRTACGLLGFFSDADVDFARPSIAWEAETEEESEQLDMLSFSLQPGEREECPPISYDLVARCFLTALSVRDREVLLRFMAKGRKDMLAGRYIDAYYSHYFFLETQFSPGQSNPDRVKAKFKASQEITGAIAKARALAQSERGRVHRMGELLDLPDDKLIEHLVDTRNTLHHHALPRAKSAWHPDKHEVFQAEALFIAFLTNEISQRQNMATLFHESVDTQLMEAARNEGVEYTYVVEGQGNDRLGRDALFTLRISLPSRSPSFAALTAVEEDIRRDGAPFDGAAIRAYAIKSTDGAEVFARYLNHTFEARESSSLVDRKR